MNETLKKNCITCQKEFQKDSRTSLRYWNEVTKFCSRICMNKYWTGRKDGRKKTGSKNSVPAWNKGISMPEAQKEHMSKVMKISAKKYGFGKWMTGKKHTIETRLKMRAKEEERIASGKHNFYIDGRTPERMVIRHSLDYKLWREAVFKRDDFTCKECKQRGIYLEAHHIKPFALFPELRFAIDNGVTLCTSCHAKVDILRARTLTKQT